MATHITRFDSSNSSIGEHTEIPDAPKEIPKKPLHPGDNGDPSKKRKTLRIMFLGYILISLGFIIVIAIAMYKSFRIDRTSSPTTSNTLVSSPTIAETQTLFPSYTSKPLPSETFTLQPSLTFTYPPYPIATENPYPVSANIIPSTVNTPIVTIIVTGDVVITEAPVFLPSDTPQPMQSSSATFTYIPTKTPTRVKHPCPCSHDLYDCKDFSTHALAQSCYDYCVYTGWGDPHNLDKDGDGIVCKGLP